MGAKNNLVEPISERDKKSSLYKSAISILLPSSLKCIICTMPARNVRKHHVLLRVVFLPLYPLSHLYPGIFLSHLYPGVSGSLSDKNISEVGRGTWLHNKNCPLLLYFYCHTCNESRCIMWYLSGGAGVSCECFSGVSGATDTHGKCPLLRGQWSVNQVCLQAAISITLKLTSATNSCTCHDDDGDDDHLLDNMDRKYLS